MYRKCVTEISVQHQKQVTQTLLQMMQKIPYEEITVTQLCQTAGITRRVFYHLFSNKSGVLHALVDHTIMGIEGYGGEIANDMLRFFCYWKDQKALLDALQKSQMTGLLLERMISIVLTEDFDVRYWLQRHGWPNDSQEVIIFGLSGLMGLVYSWYFSDYQRDPRELADLMTQMFLPHMK